MIIGGGGGGPELKLGVLPAVVFQWPLWCGGTSGP